MNKYIITFIALTSLFCSYHASALNIRGVNTPPTVVSISPFNNETNVNPTTNVVITFDEVVSLALDDAAPLTDNSIIVDCSISGIQSYPQVDTDGMTVADISFNDFTSGDICTVTVSEFWVHDEDDGNHFDGNGDGFSDPKGDQFISSFTVGAGENTDNTPPRVSMVTPTDMSGNISPDTMIVLVFNEPVDIPVNAIIINCTESGEQTFPSVLTTPVTSINYDPVDFTAAESCSITASTLLIHDTDGFPDHLDGDGDGAANGDDFESFFTVQNDSEVIFSNNFE